MPTHGRFSDAAKPLTVAMPILRPVKLPGPEAHTKRSISRSETSTSSRQPLISCNKLDDCDTCGSPLRAANCMLPRPRKTLPPSVAVSRLKIRGVAATLPKFRISFPAVRHLVGQSRQIVKFSIDANGRNYRIGPSPPNTDQEFRRMAQKVSHGDRMTHRRLIDRKGICPLLEYISYRPCREAARYFRR